MAGRPTEEDSCCPTCGSRPATESARSAIDPGQRLAEPETRVVGRFTLIDAVGAGAFGTVYLARDEQLDRLVAVKIPHASTVSSPAQRDRFFREARSAAQLRHSNIVSVFETGEHEGLPFLVSEFVWGETLEEHHRLQKLTPTDAARLAAEIADALDYAHQRGVVHRDVKAANILIDAEGHPRLTDFGLAKRDLGETTMTLDGQILGTPAYMSPEQAEGRSRDVDARSDVYSLGVVFYLLLAGELPFRGSRRMMLDQVIHAEPRRPRRYDDRIPRDLETICLKALAKEPSRRYATASAMADDLRRFLSGQPILARPQGRAERMWRWSRRNPRIALLSGAVAALLLAVTLGSSIGALLLLRAHDQTAQADARALDERRRAEIEADVTAEYANLLSGMFHGADPLGFGGYRLGGQLRLGPDTPAVDVLRAAAKMVVDREPMRPTTRAALLDRIGLVFLSGGFIADAEPHLERALEIRQATYSEAHHDLADSLHNVGCLRFAQGYSHESERCLSEALRLRHELDGPQSPRVAATQFMMAWVELDYWGATDQTVEHFRQAIDTWRAVGGPEQRDAAFGLIGLGMVYFARSEPAQAFEHFDEAAAVLSAGQGDVLFLETITHFGQGLISLKLDRTDSAAEHFQAAMESGREMMGDHHPLVSYATRMLAGYLQQAGNHASAAKLLTTAVQAERDAIGRHPRITTGLLRLAQCEQEMGNDKAAAAHRAEAIEITQAALGRVDGYEPVHRWAHRFESLDEIDGAAQLYAEALRRWQAVDGHQPPHDSCCPVACYASLLLKDGRYEQAEPVLGHVVGAYTDWYGAEALATLTRRIQMADVAELLGRHEIAESRYRAVRKVLCGDCPPAHYARAYVAGALAVCLARQDKMEEVEGLLRDSYRISVAHLGGDHEHTQTARARLIDFCRQTGRPLPEGLSAEESVDHGEANIAANSD